MTLMITKPSHPTLSCVMVWSNERKFLSTPTRADLTSVPYKRISCSVARSEGNICEPLGLHGLRLTDTNAILSQFGCVVFENERIVNIGKSLWAAAGWVHGDIISYVFASAPSQMLMLRGQKCSVKHQKIMRLWLVTFSSRCSLYWFYDCTWHTALCHTYTFTIMI